MTHVTRREWYRRVNACWPAHVPALTEAEAVRAARKLYRFVTRQTFRGEIVVTSGNRHTKVRSYRLTINAERGWHDLVHSMSHWLERYAVTHGHNAQHARLEMRMIKCVVRRGWLTGALLTPERETPDVVDVAPRDERSIKYERTLASIARWEAKQRRAENALKKLRRRQRYYERVTTRAAA